MKTTEVGGEHGYDGAKKLTGRKRHFLLDTLGFLLAVVVATASLDDAAAAPQVFQEVAAENFPRLRKDWADNKYHSHALDAWLQEHRPDWKHPRPASIPDSPGNPSG